MAVSNNNCFLSKDLNLSQIPRLAEKDNKTIYLYTCCEKQPLGLAIKTLHKKMVVSLWLLLFGFTLRLLP